MNYLYRLDINWADEIDFESSCLVSEESHELIMRAQETLKDCTNAMSMYFGTNEYNDYTVNEFIFLPNLITKVSDNECLDVIYSSTCPRLFKSWLDTIEEIMSGEYDFDDDDDDE